MAEVFMTIGAIVLRRFEVQREQLITLPCVLQSSSVGGFNLEISAATMNAVWSILGAGINLDIALSINRIDLEIFYA